MTCLYILSLSTFVSFLWVLASVIWSFDASNVVLPNNANYGRPITVSLSSESIPQINLALIFNGDISLCTNRFKYYVNLGVATMFEVKIQNVNSNCTLYRRRLQSHDTFVTNIIVLNASVSVVQNNLLHITLEESKNLLKSIFKNNISTYFDSFVYTLPFTPPPPLLYSPPPPLYPASPPPITTLFSDACANYYGIVLSKTNSKITSGIYNNTAYPYQYEILLYATEQGATYPLYQLQAGLYPANYSKLGSPDLIGLKVPFKEWDLTFGNDIVGTYWKTEGVNQTTSDVYMLTTYVHSQTEERNISMIPIDSGEFRMNVSGYELQVISNIVAHFGTLDVNSRVRVNGITYAPVLPYGYNFNNMTASRVGFLPSTFPTDLSKSLSEIYYVDMNGYGEFISQGVDYSLIKGVSEWDNLVLDERRLAYASRKSKRNDLTYSNLPYNHLQEEYCIDHMPSVPSSSPVHYTLSVANCSSNINSRLIDYLRDTDVNGVDANITGDIHVNCANKSYIYLQIFNEGAKGLLSNDARFSKNFASLQSVITS